MEEAFTDATTQQLNAQSCSRNTPTLLHYLPFPKEIQHFLMT